MFESPIPENDRAGQEFIVRSTGPQEYRSTSDSRSTTCRGQRRCQESGPEFGEQPREFAALRCRRSLARHSDPNGSARRQEGRVSSPFLSSRSQILSRLLATSTVSAAVQRAESFGAVMEPVVPAVTP